MNVKQLFAIVTLLSASSAVMAQAPANANGKTDAAREMNQTATGWNKSTVHEHKQDDGPKKSIYSGA